MGSGLTGGEIAAIVIASVFGALLIGITIFALVSSYRDKNMHHRKQYAAQPIPATIQESRGLQSQPVISCSTKVF